MVIAKALESSYTILPLHVGGDELQVARSASCGLPQKIVEFPIILCPELQPIVQELPYPFESVQSTVPNSTCSKLGEQRDPEVRK